MNYQRTTQLTTLFMLVLALVMGCGGPATTTTATLPAPTSSTPTLAIIPTAATVLSPTPVPTQPRAIVIDTDMAVDDWMAILYLLQRPDVKVMAITVTGTGEAHCAPGILHALGLVALSGQDKIPVACGRETPLQGSHAFPDGWRARVDSLLGLTLPKGQDTASTLAAVKLLTSVVQSSPDKLTLLALGPLTNVAEAIQSNPALVDNIERMYIMGGAVNVPGNVGASGVNIDNNVAEWNIYVDPQAANVVFHSGAPITLVPLDATNQVPLTIEFLDEFKSKHTSPEATFVFDMLTKQRQFIEAGYYFWDPLAAAILTNEDLATYQNNNLCVVENEGPESGWTKSGEGCPQIRVAVSADAGRFKQIFLDTLNTP